VDTDAVRGESRASPAAVPAQREPTRAGAEPLLVQEQTRAGAEPLPVPAAPVTVRHADPIVADPIEAVV
jgi:hypothetical protein